MMSCAMHYEVIYHPYPINSQYLEMWGGLQHCHYTKCTAIGPVFKIVS